MAAQQNILQCFPIPEPSASFNPITLQQEKMVQKEVKFNDIKTDSAVSHHWIRAGPSALGPCQSDVCTIRAEKITCCTMYFYEWPTTSFLMNGTVWKSTVAWSLLQLQSRSVGFSEQKAGEDGCEGVGRSQPTMCTAVTTTKAVVYPTIALNRSKLLLFLSLWKGRGI